VHVLPVRASIVAFGTLHYSFGLGPRGHAGQDKNYITRPCANGRRIKPNTPTYKYWPLLHLDGGGRSMGVAWPPLAPPWIRLWELICIVISSLPS
jgi:hypothetical protein